MMRIVRWGLAGLGLILILGLTAHLLAPDRAPGAARPTAGSVTPTGLPANLSWPVRLLIQCGRAALEAGDPQTALTCLQTVAAQLPPADRILLGDAYQQTGDLASAIAAWESAIQTGAPPESAYTRLAAAHRARGDIPALIADLRSLLALQPADAQWNYQLGLYYAATQPGLAPAYLAQAAALDPLLAPKATELQRAIDAALLADEPAYQFVRIGQRLAWLEEWLPAAEACRQATRLRPDYAEAWAFLGEALQHTGAPSEEAYAALRRALDLAPESLSAYMFIALFYQRRGEYENALLYLEQAALLYPDNAALQAERGHTLAAQGDLPEAEAAYRLAVAITPDDPTYWRALAEFALHHQIKLRELGLPAARQAVLLAPNDPRTLDVMGQALFLLGDLLTAERFFRQAIQVDAGYAPAQLHLGQIYLVQDNLEAARSQLALAMALAPDSPTAEQAQRLSEQYFP
jgi:tetratricopeptide (TPR) repeat protein